MSIKAMNERQKNKSTNQSTNFVYPRVKSIDKTITTQFTTTGEFITATSIMSIIIKVLQ